MKKQIEVVWVISKYGSPQKYGISSKPYRTAKYFSNRGITTYLISSDSNHLANYPHSKMKYNYEKVDDLNHVWIKTLKYKKSNSFKRVLSWISFEINLYRLNIKKILTPDVIIISSLSLFTILFGLRLKKKKKCKIVFEIRDIYPLTLSEELGISRYNPGYILLKTIEKKGYRESDLIVGTMPKLEKHVYNILGERKKVFFSPLGINESWDAEIKPSSRVDELLPKTEALIVGYAGSMGETNALDNYITTIKLLKDNKDIFFVLVGQGDRRKIYEEKLKGCDNVVIGPQLEQKEIPYFLSKCDILYLSTRESKVWEYGQSMNKITDYMMAGKPVVASYSGYPSMLNEAGSGTFIKTKSPEDIIEAINRYVLLGKEERKKIGLLGQKWLKENYSNDIICENYLQEIQNLFK